MKGSARRQAASDHQSVRAKIVFAGIRRANIERAIGGSIAGYVPNNYSLVREAIDRGMPLDAIKPGNKITSHLRKLILQQPSNKAAEPLVRSQVNSPKADHSVPATRVKSATAP